MVKFKAENCKNFHCPLASKIDLNQKFSHLPCTRPNCVDRKDCDGEIIDKIPETHFESNN